MKKSIRAIVTLIFCLSLIMATFIPAYAASVAQVKGVKATNITYNSAVLTWTKASKVSGYEVERYNASTKKWSKTGSDLKSSKNKLNLTKLTTGKTYKYRVRAFTKNLLGRKTYGKYSSTVSVKPMPAKVTGFKASSITATSAKLTWKKVAGATGYKIQLYKNKKWTNYKTVKTNSLSVTKLTVNTTYKYRIAAYRTVSKKNYVGAYTSSLSVKTAVGTVSGLKVSITSPTSAKATWSKLSDVSGYSVVLTDANGKKIVSKNTTSTSYSFKNLIPKAKYTLKVTAYKTISKKNYKGKTASKTVATTFAAPTALKTTVKPTSIAVSWTKAANAQGYRVNLYDKNGKQIKSVHTTSTNYTLSNITPNSTYTVKVYSYITVSGTKYYSSALSSAALKSTVAAPTALKATKTTSTSVDLSWSAAANANGYEVQYYTGGAWKTATKTTALKATVSSLASNTAYKFRVRAYITVSSTSYYSAFTSEVSATTFIGSVTNIKLDGISYSSAAISWPAVKGANGYVVSCPGTATQDITDTSTIISYLEPNTQYTVTVKAYKTGANNSKTYSGAKTLNIKTDVDFQHRYNAEYFYMDKSYDKDPSSSFVLRWEEINNAVYTVYCGGKSIATVNTNYLEVTEEATQTFSASISKADDYKTRVSWQPQYGVSSYTVQIADTTTKKWVDYGSYSGTTYADFYLAPNTTYVARVIAAMKTSAAYTVVAADKDNSSRTSSSRMIYSSQRPQIYAVTETYKTPAPPAFNANSNENKTLYTLMAVQALNNTKYEKGKVTIASDMDIVDVSLSDTIVYVLGAPLYLGGLLEKYPELQAEMKDLLNLLAATDSQTVAFNSGVGNMNTTSTQYIFDSTGKARQDANNRPLTFEVNRSVKTTPFDFVSPNSADAYFYNSQDVANFASKISNVKVSKSGTITTITLTLKEEDTDSTKGAAATPIHNGFVNGLQDQISALDGATLQLGKSKDNKKSTEITFDINANGTLNNYKVYAPIRMKMDSSEAGLTINMVMDGAFTCDYKFTR